MSVDFYATAAIGCKVPIEDALRTTRVRGCGHRLYEHFRYCPECSQPMWIEEKEWVLPHNEDGDLDLGEGLRAFLSTDREELIIATLWTNFADRKCKFVDLPREHDFASMLYKLKELLEPLGLWDEGLFGLWAIPYVSY